ncbi:MAG: adenylate/guanylate cyclase domain-containing protein [Acidimicrobiia bacterium]|nr:adenylate/guanylate cyclase domain-containing protein [Acidimicrobiia bacterium]
MSDPASKRAELEASIAALEAQREVLGDAIEPAIEALRAQIAALGPKESTEDQRKQITVLFADVKGFTAMSTTMDHEDVAEIMNSLWARIDHVIVKHGGRVDKHIGDAVMALFGAPIAREDDPERSVRAALEMQKTVAEVVSEHGPEASALKMRVGIHTGLAMLGTVGSTDEYTAIGHTVNFASRLESLADPGGILISQATMNNIVGLFDVEAVEGLEAKGVEGSFHAFKVKAAKQHTFRMGAREVAGIQTKMVGRDEELAYLKSILPDTPDDTPGDVALVTVLGGPGVGKSRLWYEYFNYLESQPHKVRLFRGRAVSSSRDTPYSLLRSIVADRFLIASSDSPADAKKKLETGLVEFVGEEGAAETAPLIGHLAGLDYTEHPAISGLLSEPRVIREKAFVAFADMLRGSRIDRYLVMMLEDVHWADDESLDLVEYVVEQCTDLPMLIMCTARSDFLQTREGWDREDPRRSEIHLEPLDRAATESLIEDVLQKLKNAPKELRELFAERSEGNPFFLEELVKMLIDEGVIEPGEEEWQVRMDALERTNIPTTLTGVIQARVDALKRVERRILQRASVVGRVFWEAAADHLAEATTPDEEVERLAEVAASLKQHELAYERQPSEFSFTREYIFKHAILHDIIYESVVRKVARVYHREAAEWMKGAAGERVAEFAGQIAEHFRRSGDSVEAVDWFVRAGDQARRTHAPGIASRAYSLALEIADESKAALLPEKRLDALAGLGDVLIVQARYEEAIETFIRLRDEAVRLEDHLAVSRAELGIATAETNRGRPKEAIESAQRATLSARLGGGRSEEARGMWLEAWASLRIGAIDEGISLAEEVLAITRELGIRDQLAEALNLEGVIAANMGDYAEAKSRFEEAASIYEEIGNPEKLMPLLNNLAVIAESTGRHDDAEDLYRRSLEIAEGTGHRDFELLTRSNLGGTLVTLEQAEDAEKELRTVLELASDGHSVLPQTHRFLAKALLLLDRLEEAASEAITSLDLSIESGTPDYITASWRVLGNVASHMQSDIEIPVGNEPGRFSPEELYEHSLEAASSLADGYERAHTLADWAVHDRKSGRHSESEERWVEARDLFTELGAHGEIERTERILARHNTVRA